jgi:CRP-like cAMP-binding protein
MVSQVSFEGQAFQRLVPPHAKWGYFPISRGRIMSDGSTQSISKNLSKPASSDGNERNTQNKILRSLPGKESRAVFAFLEFVELPTATILNETATSIEFAYFVESGLASVLNIMEDGKSVEVGLMGKEGFAGIPLLVGFKTSPSRVVMQIAGSAFRIRAKDFSALLPECPQLEKALFRLSQEMAVQSAQIAACNRLHEVDERLARWLLMCQDRLGGNKVPLTQEFLAHMLGTRRASVTVAAGMLQKAGLIKYTRGEVRVENRKELEEAACECYATIVRQSQIWRSEAEK